MATNIDVTTGEDSVVLYFQDMTTMTIEAHSQKGFQLVDNGFVTISETISAEEGEHPPESTIPDFAKKMFAFWHNFFEALKKEIQDPTATPTK